MAHRSTTTAAVATLMAPSMTITPVRVARGLFGRPAQDVTQDERRPLLRREK